MAKPDDKTDRAQQWVTTLSWPDKVIARCFPRFFERYAPDEIKKQWVDYLEKKHGKGKDAPDEGESEANAGTKSDTADSDDDKRD